MDIFKIIKTFPTQQSCIKFLEEIRWDNKPKCTYCESDKITSIIEENRYHCNQCNCSFSVTVNTIFHNTKLPLQKWFVAISMILNAKKGVSARQISRHLSINKDTAWYLGMRIRNAMGDSKQLLSGLIEMDETYIGGIPRKDSRGQSNQKRGLGTKKIPVVGLLERTGLIKAYVMIKPSGEKMKNLIIKHVDTSNSVLLTDQSRYYDGVFKLITHRKVNHSKGFAKDGVHTNTMESFWALLKRGIVGQYHKVSAKWLQKYVDEFTFKFNHRKEICSFKKLLVNAIS